LTGSRTAPAPWGCVAAPLVELHVEPVRQRGLATKPAGSSVFDLTTLGRWPADPRPPASAATAEPGNEHAGSFFDRDRRVCWICRLPGADAVDHLDPVAEHGPGIPRSSGWQPRTGPATVGGQGCSSSSLARRSVSLTTRSSARLRLQNGLAQAGGSTGPVMSDSAWSARLTRTSRNIEDERRRAWGPGDSASVQHLLTVPLGGDWHAPRGMACAPERPRAKGAAGKPWVTRCRGRKHGVRLHVDPPTQVGQTPAAATSS
jgi:hypothetical protein